MGGLGYRTWWPEGEGRGGRERGGGERDGRGGEGGKEGERGGREGGRKEGRLYIENDIIDHTPHPQFHSLCEGDEGVQI